MNIDILKLLFDFGLFVLIWLVQLVVYPSFSYYQKKDLLQWHKKYTLRISYIVIPLMLGQLILSVIQNIRMFTILNVLSLSLILIICLSTFLQFVPLHHKISSNNFNYKTLKGLVQRNWFRTILWTLVCVLDCIHLSFIPFRL